MHYLTCILLAQMVILATPRAAEEPWVEIISPSPAQLFVEGQFSDLELHFRVHGLAMGAGKGVANVYVIRNAMSYGGDAFRGREQQRANPDVRIHEPEARVSLNPLQLDLGLHQVRVHLVEEVSGQEREVAESAAFFEIRLPALPPDQSSEEGFSARRVSDEVLSNAFDEKAWLPAAEEQADNEGQENAQQSVDWTADRMWQDYVKLHARMLKPSTPAHERRLLILDQHAGGLGNRLGSVISGLLLAMLSHRALLVHWDLSDYLLNAPEGSSGIRWQFGSEQHISNELGADAVVGLVYTDMGELAPFLTCSRYTIPLPAADAEHSSDPHAHLAAAATLKIKNPHYYIPLILSNPHYRREILRTLDYIPLMLSYPHYRREILRTLGVQPAHHLMKRLFQLAPYLQAKVDAVLGRSFAHRTVIGLQIRQARWCGKLTLPADGGGRTQTNAYMTQEHNQLFYHCALTLLREYKGQAIFYLATDMPQHVRPQAEALLGKQRVVYAELPDDNVHDARAAMEEGRPTNFDGAFMDIWLLANCKEIITTAASSFGYIATALAGIAPVTVTKWAKCLRPLSSEPFSHAWPLLQHLEDCFDRRMLVPEHDMLCQDCVVLQKLQCPCGDLTCASHSEPPHPLFPRQVSQVPG